MLFNSFHFAIFFPVVLVVCALLCRVIWARNLFLLAASYYFYGCWDWRFLSLIARSTLVDYICGRLLNVKEVDVGKAPTKTLRRKLILLASLATNLGLLGFFKYHGFFVTSAIEGLRSLGIGVNLWTLRVVLPVGISFYTFQTLSYTIDVYRGRIGTERNILNFALFVAFFPQLVAGPIERASHLLPQMREATRITWDRLYTGFYLICSGMFKKVVIADNVARVADGVFSLAEPTGLSVLIGVYAFAIQIYCDFSGYSDIARGAARCMGFDVMRNFNLPYFATNPSDFWRRWHISLSSWLRDYLYIPLGGNRKGTMRTYFNLMATMVLGGLWHGAGWTFVAWGVFHGGLLCGYRIVKPWLAKHICPKGKTAQSLWLVIRVVFFFHLVCVGWLLFRARTFEQVATMFEGLLFRPGLTLVGNLGYLQYLLPCAAILVAVQLAQFATKDRYFVFRLPAPVRAVAYAVLIVGFIVFAVNEANAFIYFQF